MVDSGNCSDFVNVFLRRSCYIDGQWQNWPLYIFCHCRSELLLLVVSREGLSKIGGQWSSRSYIGGQRKKVPLHWLLLKEQCLFTLGIGGKNVLLYWWPLSRILPLQTNKMSLVSVVTYLSSRSFSLFKEPLEPTETLVEKGWSIPVSI